MRDGYRLLWTGWVGTVGRNGSALASCLSQAKQRDEVEFGPRRQAGFSLFLSSHATQGDPWESHHVSEHSLTGCSLLYSASSSSSLLGSLFSCPETVLLVHSDAHQAPLQLSRPHLRQRTEHARRPQSDSQPARSESKSSARRTGGQGGQELTSSTPPTRNLRRRVDPPPRRTKRRMRRVDVLLRGLFPASGGRLLTLVGGGSRRVAAGRSSSL